MSGCFYVVNHSPTFLPQVALEVHATVVSTSSRTIITQTYQNPSSTQAIAEVFYKFALYEGSSVAGFICKIGDKCIKGIVKPREKADEEFQKAKAAGKTAAIFDQSLKASDVFKIRVGNLPAGGKVLIEITLVAELKQDAQTNGLRYTLPVAIAPRYGDDGSSSTGPYYSPYHSLAIEQGSFSKCSVRVDIVMEQSTNITNIRSPSHPIDVQLGRTSTMPESTFEPRYASVEMRENDVKSKNFVLTANMTKQDLPCAFLETHPTLTNQRALMVSLVPKFQISSHSSEILFVVDRSGSMEDKIPTLRSALEVFLKSLPMGIHFNIVSFGTRRSFLWPRSKAFNEANFKKALDLVKTITADHGGTEILQALKETLKKCYKDKLPEILLLTDGQIWEQEECIKFVNESKKAHSARFFTLGIGNDVSYALIEGISRAGGGFSQSVLNYEELDRKVIRMLKGALMGRLYDTTLDIKMEAEKFEEIERPESNDEDSVTDMGDKSIPIFDENFREPTSIEVLSESLPKISPPSIMQVPTEIPPLFPFIRSTVYVILSDEVTSPVPTSIILRARSDSGPLKLEIPVQDVGVGETIHQLAAKRAIMELEEGRGWIRSARDSNNDLVLVKNESRAEQLVQAECERLGTRFQVAGKHCSFLAIDDAGEELEFPSCDEYGMTFPIMKMRRYVCHSDKESNEANRAFSPYLGTSNEHPNMSLNDHGNSRGSRGVGRGGLYRLQRQCYAPSRSGGRSNLPGTVRSMCAVVRGDSNQPPYLGGMTMLSQSGEPATQYQQMSQQMYIPTNMTLLSATTQETPTKTTKLQELISMQEFEGNWKWSGHLLRAIDLDVTSMTSLLRQFKANVKDAKTGIWKNGICENTIATALVVRYLETKLADSEDIWEFVKAKADNWIDTTVGSMKENDQKIVRKLIEDALSYSFPC